MVNPLRNQGLVSFAIEPCKVVPPDVDGRIVCMQAEDGPGIKRAVGELRVEVATIGHGEVRSRGAGGG